MGPFVAMAVLRFSLHALLIHICRAAIIRLPTIDCQGLFGVPFTRIHRLSA